MRPILVQIPSKLLFFLALALALALFARDLWRRKRTPGASLSGTPLFLVVGALLLGKLFSPTGRLLPDAEMFAGPWKPLPIFSYGVMLGTSMVVGWFLAMRFAKQDGVSTEAAGAIYMWTAVFSIVGARLLYVVTNASTFTNNPLDLFKIWNGGLVAYGGMIGGFLASWYGCRKRKIPLLQWADVAAPAVVLGTAVTRMGCLLFGCDFGRPTNLPWAITFPGPNPMALNGSPAWQRHTAHYDLARDAAQSLPVHPTQVYEALVGLSLFGVLLLLRRYRRFSGQVFLGWVLGYGILRPLIEVVRDDDQRGSIGPLSTSQFIGITTVALGSALLVHLWRRYRRDPESLRLWQRPALAGAAGVPAEVGASGSGGGGGGSGSGSRRRKKRK